MQLHLARLCLDCNEVHDTRECPKCGSEAFAALSRWVPPPERRLRPRPDNSAETDAYRTLIAESSATAPRRGRFLKRSALGLGAFAIAGWLWRRNGNEKKSQ